MTATTAPTAPTRSAFAEPRTTRARRTPDTGPLPTKVLLALAAITLVALGLRLLEVRGIWLDEAISAYQGGLGFGEMIENIRTTDRHPPLHYIVLWFTERTIGSSPPALRMPSIVAGTLVVPMLFVLGRALYGRRTGLVAAAFGAVAPLLIWYSQEARMYALVTLLALIVVWAQLQTIRCNRPIDWVIYVAASAALLWTHYFGVLFFLAGQLVFVAAALARRRAGLSLRSYFVPWALATVLIAWELFPLFSFAATQAELTGAAEGFGQTGDALGAPGEARSVYAAVTGFVWALWGYHSESIVARVAAAWPLAILLVLLLLGRGRSTRTLLIVTTAGLPVVALFALGVFNPNIFEPRYYIAAVPLLLLLLARLVTGWTSTPAGALAAAGVIVLTFAIGLANQQLNPSNPRLYDFRGAIEEIERRERPGDVVLVAPRDMRYVTTYLAPELDARPLEVGLPPEGSARRVFLLTSFYEEPATAARIGSAVFNLEKRGRRIDSFSTPQTRVYVFG